MYQELSFVCCWQVVRISARLWTHWGLLDTSPEALITDERTCGDCVVNFTNAKTPQVSPQVVVFSNTMTCGGFV